MLSFTPLKQPFQLRQLLGEDLRRRLNPSVAALSSNPDPRRELGQQLAREGRLDAGLIKQLQEFVDRGAQLSLVSSAHDVPAATNKPGRKRGQKGSKSTASADDEDLSDKEVIPAEVTAVKINDKVRKPRTERCALERAQLLPLTTNGRDSDWASGFVSYLRLIKTDLGSKSMVALQKLLAFVFSIEGARSLARSAQIAHSSASTITLYKDIVATRDARGQFHYSTLAEFLAHVTKQKFNNVLAEVSLLVQYVNVARVFADYDCELLDNDSEEYGQYKKVVEGHEKEFGRLGMVALRRQYILTQAVRGLFAGNREGGRAGLTEDKQLSKQHFPEMNKHLNAALTLSYLREVFDPGIHALMLGADLEEHVSILQILLLLIRLC